MSVSDDRLVDTVRTPSRGTGAAKHDDRTASRGHPGLVDEVDREIIRRLQKNGRVSNSALGRELGLTEPTIRRRITRLVSEGFVSIVAVPTPAAVGLTISAIIGISVHLQHLRDISDALAGMPEVRYVGASTGRYDVIIEAFFANQEHLFEFISEDLGAMRGVTAIETSLILKLAKSPNEWEIP